MSVKKLVAGKHTCIGQLSAGISASAGDKRLEKPCMLVYCGTFNSMDGEVEITEEVLDLLIENHNHRVEAMSRLASTPEHFERSMPPLQVDHSTSAHDTVGRVTGKLSKSMATLPDGTQAMALFADKVVILGSDNVEKVSDGRWANVSIGADLEQGTLNELSITPFPAAPQATLLSKGDETQMAKKVFNGAHFDIVQDAGGFCIHKDGKQVGGYFRTQEAAMKQASDWFNAGKLAKFSEGEEMDKMKELKARHLAEKEALSAQHEEELKGAKLEDVKSKHEEQLKKLQDKHAEELKKLGVEEGAEEEKKLDAADGDGEKEKLAAEETAETEKKESEAMKAKMSAAKPQLIKLAKGITSGMKTSRLTARKQMISAKLSGLRASAKMTPAEQKKLNLEDLAKQSDAELSAFFKGFEVRENVIDPRVHGTTKALSLASLSRLTEKSRLTRLEAEARHDMGMDMDEEHKKSLEEAKPSVAIEKEKMANDPQSSDLAMKKLEEMLSSYDQRDAVMAHVKSMMAPKELAEVAPEQAESAEKQMSALVNDFNRLQTEFSDLVNLIGDLTGVEKSELTE